MNKWLLLALAWFAAGLYALFFKPDNGTPPPFAHFDKVAHFGLFFGQFWLLAKLFFSRNRPLSHKTLFVVALLWALSSEVLQATLAVGRHGDVWDGVADAAGAACALWLAVRLQHHRREIYKES